MIESGQSVGKSSSYSGRDSTFLWTPNTPHGDTGAMVDLGPLTDDYVNTEAIKINTHGRVVGRRSPYGSRAVESVSLDARYAQRSRMAP